jgi:anti-sigma regulatory factor (Ser/Thr protein kinase)
MAANVIGVEMEARAAALHRSNGVVWPQALNLTPTVRPDVELETLAEVEDLVPTGTPDAVKAEEQTSTPSNRVATLAVPAEPCRVVSVRAWASSALEAWGVNADSQDAALLVIAELAANAARYGRSELSVLLSLTMTALQIEVADSGAPKGSCMPYPELDEDEHGRGLGIVEMLADEVKTHRGTAGWRTRACLQLGEHA